jgi:2-keto-4-pentenoate hydratase/2-oxohepta-3-ene-1,7-dioic acid hydratase in catechol pathway
MTMKLARYAFRDHIHLGLVDSARGTVERIDAPSGHGDPMIACLERDLAGTRTVGSEEHLPLAEVHLLPPITQPSKNILCIGKNYAEHAAEFTRSGYDSSAGSAVQVIPDAPIVFSKAPCAMIGAHDVVLPPWELTAQVDYEAELGVIIGRPGRAITRDAAYHHVWGYTIINDVTARDVQAKHKQWLLGKSIDTFCPIGPWLSSADEIDPGNTEVSCWVNGELRQHANTRDLIFDIPTIIATLSASMSLMTGDIIATGTPAGVGIGFTPPKFLARGDTVRIAIAGLGEIENRIG